MAQLPTGFTIVRLTPQSAAPCVPDTRFRAFFSSFRPLHYIICLLCSHFQQVFRVTLAHGTEVLAKDFLLVSLCLLQLTVCILHVIITTLATIVCAAVHCKYISFALCALVFQYHSLAESALAACLHVSRILYTHHIICCIISYIVSYHILYTHHLALWHTDPAQ